MMNFQLANLEWFMSIKFVNRSILALKCTSKLEYLKYAIKKNRYCSLQILIENGQPHVQNQYEPCGATASNRMAAREHTGHSDERGGAASATEHHGRDGPRGQPKTGRSCRGTRPHGSPHQALPNHSG